MKELLKVNIFSATKFLIEKTRKGIKKPAEAVAMLITLVLLKKIKKNTRIAATKRARG